MDYINNIIHIRDRVFIFNSQFSFVVKTIKVIPGCKVWSTHPVYIALV